MLRGVTQVTEQRLQRLQKEQLDQEQAIAAQERGEGDVVRWNGVGCLSNSPDPQS